MPQLISRFLHPVDVANRPGLEPAVERAVREFRVAAWRAARRRSGLRRVPRTLVNMAVDDGITALRALKSAKSGRGAR